MKKHLFYFTILIGLSRTMVAQSNLVPNPSFETYTTCPSTLDKLKYTIDWYSPTLATPDYFNSCNNSSTYHEVGIPSNRWGSQNAFNGVAYAGLQLYQDLGGDYCEYIQTKLTAPLVAGLKYYLSFRIALSDSSRFYTDDVGGYVSQAKVGLSSYTLFLLSYAPQVSNIQGQMLSNSTGWKQIAGEFIAVGGEEYLTIGNFMSKTNTTHIRIYPNADLYTEAYYYIDDVCISTEPETCGVGFFNGVSNNGVQNATFYYDSSMDRIIFKSASDDYEIRILDICGVVVKCEKAELNHQIDVSELKSGCYFIQVTDNSSVSCKKVLIK